MRKIIVSVLGMGIALAASAQNWQDAQILSSSEYGGTARSLGMGNALTAVGGDPGSLVFNPAGSSVSAYSQFFFSPGVSVSIVGAKGITYAAGDNEPVGFGDNVNTGYARFKVPSVGLILSLDNGRRSGWKRSAFGFTFSSSADYTSRMVASGLNSTTSYAASLASSADGYAASVLGSGDWYYNGSDKGLRPSWEDMTGYRAGLFDQITRLPNKYIALTEVLGEDGKVHMADPIRQSYGRQTTGGKNEFLINYSANYSDILYLGASVGISILNYRMSRYMTESPDDPSSYPVISYDDGSTLSLQSLRMRENLRITGSGVYLKVGAIVRPVAGLRIGAAVQTPTRMTLRERYGFAADVKSSGKQLPSATSPENDWGYAIRQPFRANVGLAYSIGNVAVISADYEAADYYSARFISRDYSGDSLDDPNFWAVNYDIRDIMGWGHQLRAGAEVKPVPWLSVRAGYNYITSGEKARFYDGEVVKLTPEEKAAKARQAFMLGLGWNGGAFYADFAVRCRFLPVEFIVPYEYYYAPNPEQYYDKVVDTSFLTPEIRYTSTMVDAIFTLGWRF